MLLDRKRIKKWARWVALGLAIIFALSFLFMGVGYGSGGGFNILDVFSSRDSDEPLSNQEKLEAYLETLEANPNDTTTMLAIATLYEEMHKAGEGKGTEYLLKAAEYMQRAIDVDPTLIDVYLRLANLYLNSDLNDSEAAAAVLNKAASVDPNNPEVFLRLGIAQQNLGRRQAAILAWQKYLQLDPNGYMADVVREQLEALTATTSTSETTATTVAPTATTAGSTTTSVQGSSGTGASTTGSASR